MFIAIIVFILILGLLILVHELGHFITARIFGVKAEEFGFGYPPRIFGWVKTDDDKRKFVGRKTDSREYKHTVWSLNWFPLGGFVQIKGQDGEGKNEPDSFASKSVWQRFIMLFAGVFMNFLLCAILLSVGLASGLPTLVDDEPAANLNYREAKVQIISILPDSPASQADLKVGDVVISIDDNLINKIAEVQDKIASKENQPTFIKIARGDEELIKEITPLALGEGDRAMIGVGLAKTAIVSYPWYISIYKGFQITATLTLTIVKAFGQIIGNIFTHGKVGIEVAGPVGIAVMTGQVAKLGWIYLLQFAALLSINLAIINLFPIPALDGGRILFLLIEKIKGSPVNQKVEGMIHQIGFILLMILILLVTFKDVKFYFF